MSASSLSLEGTLAPTDLARMFEDLAAGLRAGTVCLQKGGEFLTLTPGNSLEFEVEASARKGRQKLEFCVKWRAPGETAPAPDFRFSTAEPEPGTGAEAVGEAAPEEPAAAVEAPCESAPGTEAAQAPADAREEKNPADDKHKEKHKDKDKGAKKPKKH